MTETLQNESDKKLGKSFQVKMPASVTMFGGGLAGVPQIVPVAASLTNLRTRCHQGQSLRDISKVFKCVLKLRLHQTSHLKEESGLHVRFEDTSWSNRHSSCTKVKIVSSA